MFFQEDFIWSKPNQQQGWNDVMSYTVEYCITNACEIQCCMRSRHLVGRLRLRKSEIPEPAKLGKFRLQSWQDCSGSSHKLFFFLLFYLLLNMHKRFWKSYASALLLISFRSKGTNRYKTTERFLKFYSPSYKKLFLTHV